MTEDKFKIIFQRIENNEIVTNYENIFSAENTIYEFEEPITRGLVALGYAEKSTRDLFNNREEN